MAAQALTTEQIQKMLEDNFTYIKAIVDQQNLGRMKEMQEYQDKLQANLMVLAKLADSGGQQGGNGGNPLAGGLGAPGGGAGPSGS